MELVGGLSDAVDAHVYRVGGRTDLGEMAQMGAAETSVPSLARTKRLFETTPEDVHRELARLAGIESIVVLQIAGRTPVNQKSARQARA